jgi:hypothetical protein
MVCSLTGHLVTIVSASKRGIYAVKNMQRHLGYMLFRSRKAGSRISPR